MFLSCLYFTPKRLVFICKFQMRLDMLRIFTKISILLNESSVQFSHSIVSDSLGPHELQHTRPPCPSSTPGVHPNSRPLSQWCHPTISSSVVPSFYPQSFPASGAFPMSQLFASGGQSIGASASASVLPMNIWGWFPLDWLVWSPFVFKRQRKISKKCGISYIN